MSGSQVVTQLLAGSKGPSVEFAMGTITQAAPMLVRCDNAGTTGTPTTARRLASYTPVLGHRVAMLVIQGVDRLVLGQTV